MLSSFQGVGDRRWAGAHALWLSLALAAPLAAAPASPPPSATAPAPPPAAADAAKADPHAALQRLAEEIERIDPASPDAIPRLRAVVRELIAINRAGIREAQALRNEVAALRGQTSALGAATAPHRRSRKGSAPSAAPVLLTGTAPAGTVTTARAPSAAPTGGASPQVSGPLFGKRGLKKVHRPGCVFGERIRAEDRVFFKSMQDATAAGYEACKICRPGE
jgi:metal binding Ada-like protein